jgi:hypothetical protein
MQQILFALKHAGAGQAVEDVCRQMGISEATLYVSSNLGVLEICGNCVTRTRGSSAGWLI